MDFSWALSALKTGLKATRSSWKNSRFLWLKPATRVQPDWCHDPVLKQLSEQQNGVSATDTISVCFQEMGGAWNITTGWVPQQYDLFADDWMEWQTEEQDSIDKLPKAGGMENNSRCTCSAINQLLDKVNQMPQLHATVQPGPNDKGLTVTIVEEESDEKIAMTLDVMEVCMEAIGCHVINPDGITKSSISGDALNDKVEG